jgi:hypothetical protein
MHLQRISSSLVTATPSSPSSKPLVRWAVKAPRPSEFHIKLPREVESIHLEGRGLLRISLTTARRGKPEDNAMICLPTNEDYKNWLLDPKAQLQLLEPVQKVKKEKKEEKKQKKQEKARKKKQEKQEKQKDNKEMRKKNNSMDIATEKEEEEMEDKDDCKGTNKTKVQEAKEEVLFPFDFSVVPSREVVGFVTRGDFSFVRGKGHALGFVASMGFIKLLSNATSPSRANRLHPTFVLLRNSNSRRYIPSFLSLIS